MEKNKIDIYKKEELQEVFEEEFEDYKKWYLPELTTVEIVTRGYFDRLLKRRN